MPDLPLDAAAAAPLTHRQLSLFRDIMRHGSLSRAAAAGATSQPTLSRELARLEQLLGFELFDRVRGRLRPTAQALALMQEVERSFIGLEHIALRAQELRTLGAARLRLACLPALAHALVPRALRQLAALQPQALVSVHPMESPWLEQALAAQRFDLGVGEASSAPDELASRLLLDCQEVAVLPSSHALCRKPRLELQDFAGQRFINLAPQDPYRQAIDRRFAEAGVQRLQYLETESAVAICAMVRQGLGLAIVNPLSALECAGPGLEVRALNASLPFHVRLLLPQVASPHPLRAALEQALQQAAQEIDNALAQTARR